MTTVKRKNGEGTVRKIDAGIYEAVCQSSIPNPKTLKYKRFKRRGATAEGALSAAKMAMKAWEKEIIGGNDVKIDKKKTFIQYIYDYLDEIRKPNIGASSYHSYIRVTRDNLENEPIANYQLSMLNKEVFIDYYNAMLEKKSFKTMSMPFQFCKGCCQWLVDRSLLEENYALQAYPYIKKEIRDEFDYKKADELSNVKEVFTTEDIEKIYEAWQKRLYGEYTPVFLLLLDTGLRAQEFASLRLQCIDLDKREIYVREATGVRFKDNDRNSDKIEFYDKTTKNRYERTIKISDLSYEIILWMIEQTKEKCRKGNPGNLLYPTFISGRKRSNSTMEVGMKGMFDKCGIDRGVQQRKLASGKIINKGLCLHSIRHTYETLVRQNSENNLVAVALSTGHKTDMRMEDHYTHQHKEAIQGIITPSEQLLRNSRVEQEKPLNEANTEPQSNITEDELYQMYLKLKEKFE